MRLLKIVIISLFVVGAFSTLTGAGHAQSSDQNLPTPVLSNEVSGKIDALDLGDPRLTRHYYAFSSAPGDLLITLDSKNLNGDIDVFTAVTFRPLMKTTMYASGQSQEITKGIYLRTQQILILRVEARTPNDDPGTYHIRLGGTFQPFSGGIPVAENSTAAEAATERADANRLSSVGATIPRPISETAEAKPSPEKPSEEPEAANKPAETSPRTTTRRNTARNTRRGSRPAPARPAPVKKTDTEATADKTTKGEEKPTTNARSRTETSKKPQELPQLPSTRLIIEEKDGTRIERSMSTVRRVIIEGGAIVIVLKTGKIERVPMSQVVRMAIEPE